MAEAGYPGVEGIIFTGLLAAKGTPADVIEAMTVAVRKALTRPTVVEQLAAFGTETKPSSAAEFATFLKVENDKWTEGARKANIKGAE